MFWNIYSKRVISNFRSKDALIWTWLFPIMMATLFYFGLSNIDAFGALDEIRLGVVDNASYNGDQAFKTALESFGSTSAEEGKQLVDIRLLSNAEEGDSLLENRKIDGYILHDGDPALVVAEDGLNQTIIKSFLDQYLQARSGIENLIRENPAALSGIDELLEPINFTRQISLTDNPATDSINYFYALLAMVCMYGSFQGLSVVMDTQANLSDVGARHTLAPVRRYRKAAIDILAAVTLHFMCMIFVVAFMMFVLGINFGNNLGMIILTCLVGSVLGVSFGTMVGSVSKWKLQVKSAVLISISMVCSYFSGLMVSGINYTIAKDYPVLAWINPAARITDAFYCLYYFDGYERFFLNLAAVLGLSAVMLIITFVLIGRQRYESI